MDGARIMESVFGFIWVFLTIALTVHAITGWGSLSWAFWTLGALLVLIYVLGLSSALNRAVKPILDDPMAHPHGDAPFVPKSLKRRSF